ncbi:hypothetical protein LCGC14_1495050, partial [marine sediment metagenome]
NKARYRRDAFGLKDKDFNPYPNELVETYVQYYTIPKKPDDWPKNLGWYQDDWFLQENEPFHQSLVDYGNFTELRDFKSVPPRELFETEYIYFAMLEAKKPKYYIDELRLDNPEWDEWGVAAGIWTRTMSEQRRRAGLSSTDLFLEDTAEAREKLRDIMRALGEELQ